MVSKKRAKIEKKTDSRSRPFSICRYVILWRLFMASLHIFVHRSPPLPNMGTRHQNNTCNDKQGQGNQASIWGHWPTKQ